MLQKKELEQMMKEPKPKKRVSIVRLKMLREDRALYGMERITDARQAAGLVDPLMEMADRELMVVLSLDTQLEPVAAEIAAVGGVDFCQIDIRNVFKHAILSNAGSIICFHNHPSGDARPSEQDCVMTKQMERAGVLLGIRLLDHIILGKEKIYSFRNSGRLEMHGREYTV